MSRLSSKQIQEILASINKKVDTTTKAIKASNPKHVDPAQVVEENTQVTNKKAPNFFGKILNVAKSVAPAVVSAINPVAGGVTKMLMSTLNDDEWFEEFKPAGATFSEVLKAGKINDYVSKIVPGFTQIQTDFAPICYESDPYTVETPWVREIMPSVLAYIRHETNNVLMDNTTLYTQAFVANIRLFSIYYTLRKYEKLAQYIPENNGTLPLAVNALKPELYNQLIGIADSLEGYLKSTGGLPYALAEYLRWRYGTIFNSDNTGRPSLISYDPLGMEMDEFYGGYGDEDGDGVAYTAIPWVVKRKFDDFDLVQALKENIGRLQQMLQNAGRAAADIALAYKNHQIRYDVENRHYDEKEYNLRINSTCPGRVSQGDKYMIMLDSRLDPSAAIQAVTLNTYDASQNPASYMDTSIHFVRGTNVNSKKYMAYKTSYTTKVKSPFYVRDVIFLVNDTPELYEDADVFGNFDYTENKINYEATTSGILEVGFWRWYSITEYSLSVSIIFDDPDQSTPFWGKTMGPNSSTLNPDSKNEDSQFSAEWVQYFNSHMFPASLLADKAIIEACLIATQMHNASVYSSTANNHIAIVDTLAYDTATLNVSQIEAIQVMALRNLTRGNYKGKTNTSQVEAKEALVEAVETVSK